MKKILSLLCVFSCIAFASCHSSRGFPNGNEETENGPDGGNGDEGPSGSGGGAPPGACVAKRHGANFVCWYDDCYTSVDARASLENFKAIGGNAIAIIPTWYQATGTSSIISRDATGTPSDDDIRAVVATARELDFEILFKPHVDCDDDTFRGDIEPADLGTWQTSYRDFILHYAVLAEELGVEIFSIGTELKGVSGDTPFWRDIITDIKAAYSGELTYSANWDEYGDVGFWDDLNYIGIDFYFPLTDENNPSREAMVAALEPIAEDLKTFSESTERPFLITEVGYRSTDGTNIRPYYFGSDGDLDLEEQADATWAFTSVFEDESWLEGSYWWRWDPDPTEGGLTDEDYILYGKPAADVLSELWSESPTCEAPSSAAVSFVAFGDWGGGSDDQRAVAAAIGDYCALNECEFILTLGDNFYDAGVSSVTDPLWDSYYHDVYDFLGLPFYASLGNHDNTGNIEAQIAYSAIDPNWIMPAETYTFGKPDDADPPLVEFFIVNSDYDYFPLEDQLWLAREVSESNATWKLYVAHHPIYSNGRHGDGDPDYRTAVLLATCGDVDLYVTGHDHSFAHMRSDEDGCLIDNLVIGTGGRSTREIDEDDSRALSTGSFFGFGWFAVTPEEILFRMITTEGEVFYETTWTK